MSNSDPQNTAEALGLTKVFEMHHQQLVSHQNIACSLLMGKLKLRLLVPISRGSVTNSHFKQVETSRHHIELGQWWQVTYDEVFPGEVIEVRQNKCKVLVMVPVNKYWKWLKEKDKIYYQLSSFIRQVKAPTISNSRGHFKFDED